MARREPLVDFAFKTTNSMRRANTNDDHVDGMEMSESTFRFKRIQEFVTERPGQQQDKMFFQVKCVNANQQEPPMTSVKTTDRLCSERSPAEEMEDRTKSFAAVNATQENADGNSDSRGGLDMTGTVVEDDARMSNLMALANTSPGAQSSRKGGRIANSQERTLVSTEASRRPKSTRAPTVISLPGFAFQKLPDLFPTEERPPNREDEVQEETKTKAAAEESTEKRDSTEVHRRLKMRISPKRVVVPDVETRNLDDSDRRFYVQHPRRAKQTASLQVVEELLQEEYSSLSTTADAPKRKRKTKKAKTGRPRKTSRKNASPQEAVKKRSLRSVIQRCHRKRRGGIKGRTPFDGTRPYQLHTQNKTVYTQHQNSTKKLKDDASLRFGKDVWSCPIVAHLLAHKLVNVGDTVELLSEDADPLFHGWFTTRGILCSNCGMVHSCNTFGECDGQSGTSSRLYVKNDATLKQLLSGHHGIDLQ